MAASAPSNTPGVLFTGVIAVAAVYLHQIPVAPFTMDGRHPIDALIVAILLGMVLRNVFDIGPTLAPGITYSVKKLLPFAIILMGAKLDFFDVLRISGQALLISLSCVTVALALTIWLCDKMNVGKKLGLLISIGTAICGGTAIAVSAPVIEADENDTAFAITTITVFGLVAIFIFPPIGHLLALDQTEFGVWAGVAIHATPQVMAAGFSYGPTAGDVAVIVKLVRVLLLAPIIVLLGAWYARRKRAQQQAHVTEPLSWRRLFPPFILGFIGLAIAKTLHLLPDFTLHLQKSLLWEAGDQQLSIAKAVTTVSGFLITMAMAGVGLGVHIKTLRKVGLKALYAGMVSAVVLSGFGLLLLKLFL